MDTDEQTLADTEDRDGPKPGMKVCPTCKGSGKIMGGNRTCPECKGSGEVPVGEQKNDASTDLELREEGESTATTLTHTAAGDVLTPVTVVRRRKERHRSVPLMPEVRHWGMQPTSVEIRSAKDTDEAIVTGSPIVYLADYTVFDMFGKFTERMARGVASELLKRGVDTRFLFNHDDMPLARTTSGTMTLQDGERSLDFEARLDMRQQCANDLVIAIGRGDVTQMSCGFMVGRDEWDDAMEDRTIYQLADLLDVSAVTYPASPTTSIEVAQRMLSMAPIESRARLRNFLVAERAGKVLSGATNGKVVSAIEALHSLYEAGGGNPADLIEDDGSSESESDETALAQDGTRGEDGEPIRSSALALRLQLEARSQKRKRLAA